MPGLVQEFVPSTLIGLYLFKSGQKAPYQQPHASEMMQLSHKSVAVMLSRKWRKLRRKLSLSQENISNLSATDTNKLTINEDR